MPEPQNLLGDELLVENELENLYAVQDKPSTKQRREIMVRELMAADIPIGALLSGIRRLKMEEMGAIKLATILRAAREYIEPGTEEEACADCYRGMVTATDDEGRYYGLACHCAAGAQKFNAQGLRVWDGTDAPIWTPRGTLSIKRFPEKKV